MLGSKTKTIYEAIARIDSVVAELHEKETNIDSIIGKK